MIYKYELACREAGLTEEQIANIRKVFKEQYDRMAYEKNVREKLGITFNNFSSFGLDEDEDETIDFADPDTDVEEEALHEIELGILRDCIKELPVDDREFLYAYYGGEYGVETALAKKYGVPRTTLQRRKERLLKRLKKSFFEKY